MRRGLLLYLEEVGLLRYFRKAPHATASWSINRTTREEWALDEMGGVWLHPWWDRTLGYAPGHHLQSVGFWLGLGASPADASV